MIAGSSAEKPIRMTKLAVHARTSSNHTVMYGRGAGMDAAV